MKVFEVKHKKKTMYFPESVQHRVQNDTLSYVVEGEGRYETKKFKVLEIDLPEVRRFPWLDIMYIYKDYGWAVAEPYVVCKTWSRSAKSATEQRFKLFKAVEDILDKEQDREFFELIKIDGLFTGGIDIIATDERLSEVDPEYDCDASTYKGECISMREYITEKYGERRAKIIECLIDAI